ncbi:MAG TPA: hypothetical protein VM534_01545, partial [Thermoanaerobaculia bacterium]|nr:hypothetical protein [Thermoanaerobaculia bacterium]
MSPRHVLVLLLIVLAAPHHASSPEAIHLDHPDFQIEFPPGFLEPLPMTDVLSVPGVTAHQYASIRGAEICIVWYADFAAPGTALDPDTILHLGINGLRATAGMVVENEELLRLGELRGRRLWLTGRGKEEAPPVYLRQDLLVLGPRLYQLSCGGMDRATRERPDIQTFFNSFRPVARGRTGRYAIVEEEEAMANADILRSVATAWEAFATDSNAYLDGSVQSPPTPAQDVEGVIVWSDYREISYEQLRKMLTPTYIRSLPRVDAWGNPLSFAVTVSEGTDPGMWDTTTTSFDPAFQGASSAQNYLIRSLGADGRESDRGVYRPGEKTDHASDVIFGMGTLITRPAALGRIERRMEQWEAEAARVEEQLQRERLAK